MLKKSWTHQVKNLALSGCCAIAMLSNFSVQAGQEVRQELDQMLINLEDVQIQVQNMGHNTKANELQQQLDAARAALSEVSDDALNAYDNSNNLQQVLLLDDMLLEAVEGLQTSSARDNNQGLQVISKSQLGLANAVPSTSLAIVDTENLELEGCADQVALTAVATPLRAAVLVTEGVVEVTPANIVSAGQSIPNPLKAVAIIAKSVAKTLLAAADEAIRFNALCTLRNERKIAREYIQARQVRYTPRKTIEAAFDVVRPENLGGNKKYRYTFWMHTSVDGQATDVSVNKVMASQLSDEADPYVTLSNYSVTKVADGLYKLVFDTPIEQGLDYVRGFVVHMETSRTSPSGVVYKHHGVAHIRSDVNSGTF